jgi:membrane fusion protein (multidrug efflux system)
MRYIWIPVIALALLSCGGKGGDASQKKSNAPVPVEVMLAGNEEVKGNIEANGTVLSEDMVEFHPEMSGRITYLNFPEGSRVAAGTVLARINDADLQAQLEQLQVELDLAKRTEQRYSKLLAVNGIDQATYDAALNQVDHLKAQIKIQNALIDKSVIKAPFAGVLGLRQVSIGSYVSPANAIGTLQSDQVKIDFTLPEVYGSLVKPGSKVQVMSSTDETVEATVSAVEPAINVSTRNIRVRARLDGGSLRSGSFVKVLLEQKHQGILVPTNAIIPDAMANQLVVVKKGKGVFCNVETGLRTGKMVEIISGISKGDSVVVNGVLFVRPNAAVKITKVKDIKDIMK